MIWLTDKLLHPRGPHTGCAICSRLTQCLTLPGMGKFLFSSTKSQTFLSGGKGIRGRENCRVGKMVVWGATSSQSWISSFSVYVSFIDRGADYGKMQISAVRQVDIKTGITLSSVPLQAVLHSRKVQYFTRLNMFFHLIFIALFETDIEGVFFLSACPGLKPLMLANKEGRLCISCSVCSV